MSRMTSAAAGITLLAIMSGVTLSQQSIPDGIASDAGMMARTSPTDAIFARRLLMSAIGTNNDTLHDTFDGVFEYDQREVKHRLGAISDMLLAFPHLYRVEPDVWTQEEEDENPGTVTLSSPAVWENWEGFITLAQQASDMALEASLASTPEAQKALTDKLEGLCESCHGTYRRELTALELEDVLAR